LKAAQEYILSQGAGYPSYANGAQTLGSSHQRTLQYLKNFLSKNLDQNKLKNV